MIETLRISIQKLTEIFSTREQALIIWLIAIILLMISNKSLRQPLLGIIKALFVKQIVLIFALLIIYILLLLRVFQSLGLWDVTLIKDTIFWFFGFVPVTFLSINKAKDINYFRNIAIESFRWLIFIEFLINFYTFNLISELVLFPTIISLTMTRAYAQIDERHEKVNSFLANLLAFIGIAFFLFSLFKTFTEYKNIFTFYNLKVIILPPVLTTLLLPFYYLLALYIQYEELFIRIRFMSDNNSFKKKLKKELFITIKLNLNKLTIIRRNLNKSDLYRSTDIRMYLQSLLQKK